MNRTKKVPATEWVSAAELDVPTGYEDICKCTTDKVESSYAKLAQQSDRKLTDFYNGLGDGEMKSLKSRLYFVAAMLLEQTAETGQRRDMVKTIRELHKANPLHPSVATVYRVSAPLKVWLGKKCNLAHAPSVGDLRTDRRPLLLLTEENILGIVAECKTSRKFAEKYRPKHQPKPPRLTSGEATERAPETAPGTTHTAPSTPSVEPEKVAVTGLLIQGELAPDDRQAIVKIIGNKARFHDLNETQLETVRQWFNQT